MIREIQALPPLWFALAYGALVLGLVFVVAFIGRYTATLPWTRTEEGRHLVAMSATVGAFFALYLLLAVWPELPGRSVIRLGLLLVLVGNCGWRYALLERHLRERRRAARRDRERTE